MPVIGQAGVFTLLRPNFAGEAIRSSNKVEASTTTTGARPLNRVGQLRVESLHPALEERFALRPRGGTGRATATGCGNAVEHGLEARRIGDAGHVDHHHPLCALVQHLRLDHGVERVGQCRHVLAAAAGQAGSAAARGCAHLGRRQLRPQQRHVGRATVADRRRQGRQQVGAHQAGGIVAAAVDHHQVTGRIVAGLQRPWPVAHRCCAGRPPRGRRRRR